MDAAVATALAAGVVQPAGSGLGGGGFAVWAVDGETGSLDFREMAPAGAHADLYLDADGNVVDGQAGFNYAGFVIHSAIHANVPDAKWIMHTHTKEGAAVSCKRSGMTNTNFYSAMIWEHLAYHDFEGLTVHDDERERIVSSIGENPCVVLRNHGLLSHGRSVQEAFARLWTMQLACETQLLADSMAGDNIEISAEATRRSTHDSGLFNSNDGATYTELFAALQRIVDDKDSGYRH